MSNRIDRANALIKKTIQDIIQFHMNDPRITSFVGVSDAKVTPDFRYCKVKISLTDDDYSKADEIISVLKKSEGYIKNKLSEMIKLPYTPKLDFVFDKNMQNAIRVEQLLKNLNIPMEESYGNSDETTE